MRLLLAAINVFGSMLLYASFVGWVSPHGAWPWWGGPGLAVVSVGTLAGSLFVFNRPGPRAIRPSLPQQLANLREKGLVEEQRFTARRAFAVEEWEGIGLNYFLELTDGRTLLLSGKYLYDYEPIEEDTEVNRPRQFPCTEFTVQRHLHAHYPLGLICGGVVLAPEAVAPCFREEEYDLELYEDGMIFKDRSYDEIKQERLRA